MTVNPEYFPELADTGIVNVEKLTSDQIGFDLIPTAAIPTIASELHKHGHDDFIHTIPYQSAVAELEEHAAIYLKTPNTPEELATRLARKFKAAGSTTKTSRLTRFLSESVVVHDVVKVGQQFREKELGSTNAINSRANWLRDKQSGQLIKWVGVEEHRLLQSMRTLGIIPRAVIEKLARIRINVAGCSASTSSINLLALLGAENFGLWDGGDMSPTKIPLTPDASIYTSGQPKSIILKSSILKRNPYAKVNAHVGLLLHPDDPHATKPNNITYDEFAQSEYQVEGIDQLHKKAEYGSHMQKYFPNKKITYLADVSVRGYANISKPRKGDHFGLGLTKEQLLALTVPKVTLPSAIGDLFTILGPNLPPEHALQLLLTAYGEMQSWSQTMIAGIQASLVVSALILQDLQNGIVYNNNTRVDGLPESYIHTTPLEGQIIYQLARETLHA